MGSGVSTAQIEHWRKLAQQHGPHQIPEQYRAALRDWQETIDAERVVRRGEAAHLDALARGGRVQHSSMAQKEAEARRRTTRRDKLAARRLQRLRQQSQAMAEAEALLDREVDTDADANAVAAGCLEATSRVLLRHTRCSQRPRTAPPSSSRARRLAPSLTGISSGASAGGVIASNEHFDGDRASGDGHESIDITEAARSATAAAIADGEDLSHAVAFDSTLLGVSGLSPMGETSRQSMTALLAPGRWRPAWRANSPDGRWRDRKGARAARLSGVPPLHAHDSDGAQAQHWAAYEENVAQVRARQQQARRAQHERRARRQVAAALVRRQHDAQAAHNARFAVAAAKQKQHRARSADRMRSRQRAFEQRQRAVRRTKREEDERREQIRRENAANIAAAAERVRQRKEARKELALFAREAKRTALRAKLERAKRGTSTLAWPITVSREQALDKLRGRSRRDVRQAMSRAEGKGQVAAVRQEEQLFNKEQFLVTFGEEYSHAVELVVTQRLDAEQRAAEIEAEARLQAQEAGRDAAETAWELKQATVDAATTAKAMAVSKLQAAQAAAERGEAGTDADATADSDDNAVADAGASDTGDHDSGNETLLWRLQRLEEERQIAVRRVCTAEAEQFRAAAAAAATAAARAHLDSEGDVYDATCSAARAAERAAPVRTGNDVLAVLDAIGGAAADAARLTTQKGHCAGAEAATNASDGGADDGGSAGASEHADRLGQLASAAAAMATAQLEGAALTHALAHVPEHSDLDLDAAMAAHDSSGRAGRAAQNAASTLGCSPETIVVVAAVAAGAFAMARSAAPAVVGEAAHGAAAAAADIVAKAAAVDAVAAGGAPPTTTSQSLIPAIAEGAALAAAVSTLCKEQVLKQPPPMRATAAKTAAVRAAREAARGEDPDSLSRARRAAALASSGVWGAFGPYRDMLALDAAMRGEVMSAKQYMAMAAMGHGGLGAKASASASVAVDSDNTVDAVLQRIASSLALPREVSAAHAEVQNDALRYLQEWRDQAYGTDPHIARLAVTAQQMRERAEKSRVEAGRTLTQRFGRESVKVSDATTGGSSGAVEAAKYDVKLPEDTFYLFADACDVFGPFRECVRTVAEKSGAVSMEVDTDSDCAQASRKPLARSCIKALQLHGGRMSGLTDLVRGTLVFGGRDATAQLHSALQLIESLPTVTLLRVRNSLCPSPDFDAHRMTGGYRQVSLLLLLSGYEHVVELCLHLEPLYTLRCELEAKRDQSGRGAHDRYRAWRAQQRQRVAW